MNNGGAPLPQRAAVNFTNGLKATDNAGSNRTDLEADNTIVAFLLGAQTLDQKTLTSAGNIAQAGAATFTTGTGAVTLNGSVTISTLGTGVLHSNASGLITSSAVNLAGGSSEVTGTLPVANGGTGAATLGANGILQGNGTSAVTTIAPGAAGTVLRSNGTNAVFQQLAAADINNTGAGQFLVNVPATTAANTVAPTNDVTGILIRQTTAASPTADVFAIVNSTGATNFLKVDASGNTTIGNSGVTSGNTLTVQTGATTGNAVNINSGATSGTGLNVTTGTTTGAAVNINTGAGVTSDPTTSGTALNINTGASTFSNGVDPTSRGGALNISSTGVFGGIAGEAALVKVSATGNFSGALVSLVADQTQTGTILGISGTSLTTGRAVDVNLGGLYSGTADGAGAIGAVNIRSGAFTGNILSVSAKAAGATANSNLALFQSPQIDGRLVHVNVLGAYGGAGAVAINSSSSVSGTLLRIGGNSITTGNAVQVHLGVPSNGPGCPGACANPDPTVAKALNVALGTTGTGIYMNTDAAYAGNFVDFRRDGVAQLSVDQTGGITTAGNFLQTGTATFTTGSGAIALNGDVTVAAGKTVTAGAGTTTGTAVTVATGDGLTTGRAVAINTGTSAFSTNGGGLSVTSTGAFTGTLTRLTADSATTGTILGVKANALTTGAALEVDLGSSALTGNTQGAVRVSGTGTVTGTVTGLTANSATTGTILGVNATGLSTGKALDVNLGASTLAGNTGAVAIRSTGVIASGATVAAVTANSATSGTLLRVEGTAVGASTGTGLSVAIGTPTGTDPSIAKAISLALGTTGTALYANAATGYTGNFLDFRVNGTSALTVSETGAITTTGNFSQTGATTFSTGTGAVSLNGATTVTGTNTFAVTGGLATFGGGLTISAGNFTQSGSGTFSTGTGTNTLNGPLTVVSGTVTFSNASLQGGALVTSAAGALSRVAPGASGNVLTSNGTTWVSQAPGLRVLDKQTGSGAITLNTVEQTLYTFSVPGGSLGTNNALRLSIHGTLLNDSGANRTYTIRVKYGATTLFGDVTPNVADSGAAIQRAFLLDLTLAANAATSAQTLGGQFTLSPASAASVAGTGDFAAAGAIIGPVFHGSSAIDSTVAQTLTVTVQSSSATATQNMVRSFAVLTLLQ